MTLTHLQDIASNYNVYYNMDARFQGLVEQSQAIALAMNQSQAAIQGDVAQLKTWFRKSQRRSRKMDARLQALDLSLNTKNRQWVEEEKEQKAQREATASLAVSFRALQDALASLTQQVHSQDARLAVLEGQIQRSSPSTVALGLWSAPPSLLIEALVPCNCGGRARHPSLHPNTGVPPKTSLSTSRRCRSPKPQATIKQTH